MLKKYYKLLAILLLLVLILSGCGTKKEENKIKDEVTIDVDYEFPIVNWINGIKYGNLEQYKKAFPEFYLEEKDIDEKEMEKMAEALEDTYGRNIKIKYEIIKEDNISKDDLEKVREYIEKVYDEKNIKISEGKEIKLSITIKGDVDTDVNSYEISLYKINGEWKMLNNVSPRDAKIYLNNNKK